MGTLPTPKQAQDMLDITAKVLDTACLPLDVAKMLSANDSSINDVGGLITNILHSIGDAASIVGMKFANQANLLASTFSLEKGISDANKELDHNALSASTVTSILSDTASILAVGGVIAAGAVTPAVVVLATGGLLLSVLSYNLGYDKRQAQKDFAKFSTYLKSDEAREYLNCPNCLNIDISNPKVYENDGIANFTITLSKPLKETIRLRLFTVQGSATQDKDYIGIEKKNFVYVEIPAGTTEYTQPISIVRDGKYEGQEDFLLVVDDIHYTGTDVSHIINKDGVAVGLGTIIDIEQDKCPKPVTPNFSLNFPLPSSPSVYYPTYGGGSWGGSSGGGSWGGGSGGTYTPTYTPQPDIPYIPCPPTLEESNSALVLNLNSVNSNNNNSNSNNNPNNNNPTPNDPNVTYVIMEANPSSQDNQTSNSTNTQDTLTQPNKIYFDYNNDGFKENMLSWFNKDEVVLVNDINNNGIVDNGSEILGNNYTNKFGQKTIDILSLLDEFDTNNDGIINNKDNHNLAIWIDINQNGKTDKDELTYIDDINSPIKSINISKLDKLLSGYDRNYDLKINASDGIYNHIYMQEVINTNNENLNNNSTNNIAINNLMIVASDGDILNSNDNSSNSNNINNPINLYIYGDDSARAFLGDKTTNFILQTNKGEVRVNEVVFYTDLPEFIKNYNEKPQENIINGEFEGDTYAFDKSNKNDIILADSNIQTIEFVNGINKSDLVFEVLNQGTELKISLKNRPNNTLTIKSNKITKLTFADNSQIDLSDIKILEIDGRKGDYLWLQDREMQLHNINGTDNGDEICGNLYTKAITGGKGDDIICGAWTDTVYYFRKGDGKDWIQDAGGANDTIKFVDFNYEDVEFKQSGYDLIITSKISDDQITIDKAYDTRNNLYWWIENFEFKDKIYNFVTGELTDNNSEFNEPIVSLNDGIYFYDDAGETKFIIQENFNNQNLNPYSLQANGISEILLQSGYVGNGARVGANGGEISFDYKWFKSDNLDTIYEKDGVTLNTASGRVRDINDAANDNPDLKQNIQDLKTNLIDKAFDDISLDMDNILEKWILNDNILGKDLNLNESTNLANSFMSVRSNESFTTNLKADENAETSSNNNTLINEANEKKIAIVEAYRGAKLSDIQKANPYIILGVLKEYDNIKFDAMKRIFAEQLFPSVSNCAQMLRALNNNLNRIVNSNATPQEIALSINLLAASLQRDYDYTIFHLTKVNQSPVVLTNPVIMNLLSKVGVNFSISNGEIKGIIGKHNFGNSESESYDFSENANGVNINAKGGNDIIIGSEFNDEIIGENGNDIIFSGKGIDIVRGGAGNDLIIGSDDTTIYEYYLGDGDDIIYDDGGVDILRFAFLKSDDINIVKNGDDMIINISNPYDKNATIGSITIKNGLTSGKIEQYYFNDKIYSFDEFARLKGLVDDTPNTEPLNPSEPSDNPQPPLNHAPTLENEYERIELSVTRFGASGYLGTTYTYTIYDGNIGASDIDGDKLSYKVLNPSANFVLDDNGNYRYTTTKGSKLERIQIEVSDNKGGVVTKTLEFDTMYMVAHGDGPAPGPFILGIVGENNAPTIEQESEQISLQVKIDERGESPIYQCDTHTGKIIATDIDGDEISYKVCNPSSNFVLNDDGSYTYTTTKDSCSEIIYVIASDNKGGEAVKALYFDVDRYVYCGNKHNIEASPDSSDTTEINHAPTLEKEYEKIELNVVKDNQQTPSYSPPSPYSYTYDVYEGNIGATDIDGDKLSYKILNPSENFVLNDDGSYVYTTTKDSKSEQIQVEVSDGKGGVAVKTLEFDVKLETIPDNSLHAIVSLCPPSAPIPGEPINHAPIIQNYSENITLQVKIDERGENPIYQCDTYTGKIIATDIDGDELRYGIGYYASENFVLNSDGSYTYTTTKDSRSEKIYVIVSDGKKNGCSITTLNFDVERYVMRGNGNQSIDILSEITENSIETNANSEANFNKIANDLAFRFGENNFNKSSVNSSEFANSTNSENSGYITANQMDKIIEQLNTYSDDKGLGNFAFNDMQNSVNLQIYG